MYQSVGDTTGDYAAVEAGLRSYAPDGHVRVVAPVSEVTLSTGERAAALTFTPGQARNLAAVLLRAADIAEAAPPAK
ncbi:MAG: hypothetical protein ACRDXB_05570 [Actinomycetes bacterium]